MITEDYCSPEVAKLLDKKGFREYCEAIYFIYTLSYSPNGDEVSEKKRCNHSNST